MLTQVAGHRLAVVKVLPALMLHESDVEEFAEALRTTVKQASRMPSSLTRFALSAAGIR